MRYLYGLFAIALMALGGCDTLKATATIAEVASTKVDMTELNRAAFAARAAYAGYVVVAAEYNELRRCTIAPAPCSSQAVVNLLRDGIRTAGPATKAAVDVVKNVGTDPSVAKLVVEAAQRSVATFKKVINDNKVGG